MGPPTIGAIAASAVVIESAPSPVGHDRWSEDRDVANDLTAAASSTVRKANDSGDSFSHVAPARAVAAGEVEIDDHRHLSSRRAEVGWHRAHRLQALDVMISMHREGARVVDVVGHAIPGERGTACLVLEDHQRLLPGGAAMPADTSPIARRRETGNRIGHIVRGARSASE